MDVELLLRFERLEDTHWWFVGRRALVLETARRWAPQPLDRIVDAGCGTGGGLRALASAFPSATTLGVEPSEQALSRAAERGCAVVGGSLEDLPLETAGTDLLLALDVLEHIDDDTLAVAEIGRVVRPGGRLIVTVPALPWLWGPHDEVNEHKRRYRRAELLRLIGDAGFAVERLTYFNTFLLPLGIAERFVSRRLGRRASLGLRVPPSAVNAALTRTFGLEVELLRRRDLPIGMSLLLVATRVGRDGDSPIG